MLDDHFSIEGIQQWSAPRLLDLKWIPRSVRYAALTCKDWGMNLCGLGINSADGSLQMEFIEAEGAAAIAPSSDGTSLALVDDPVDVINSLELNPPHSLNYIYDDTYQCSTGFLAAYSPQGATLFTVGSAGDTLPTVISMWNMRSGRCDGVFAAFYGWPLGITLSPDGTYIAIPHGSRPGEGSVVDVWSVPSGQVICTLPGVDASFSSTSNTLAIFDPESDQIVLADPTSCRNTNRIPAADHPAALAFSPDGELIALADTGIDVWNALSARLLFHIGDLGQDAIFVSFSSDGRYILVGTRATVSKPARILIWQLNRSDPRPPQE